MPAAYGKDTTAEEVVSGLGSHIRGKVVLTTGVSPGGLGAHFVEAIAKAQPGLLILAGRNLGKAEETAKPISELSPTIETRLLRLDLASLKQVRQAAEEVNAYHENIDVLVNNAGIMAVPYSESEDGFESQFASNHLGPFLFTNLIMPRLLASGPDARVVNVSSDGYRISHVRYDDCKFHGGESYDPWIAYGQSKTANILFSHELARRLGPKGLLSYSLHPGVILTNLPNHLGKEDFESLTMLDKQRGMKQGWSGPEWVSPSQGVTTHIVTAFSPNFKDHNGAYFEECKPMPLDEIQPWALGDRESRKCWNLSEQLVGQEFSY